MDNPILLSLCIPTNGIIDWVFPLLDSIYCQKANPSEFEVIVTNNGNNNLFHEKMLDYASCHSNLTYMKTESLLFYNQLDSLRLARGSFLKFINHRSVLIDGSIEKMINIIKENIAEKPVMYFSNGVLKKKEQIICDSFDSFIFTLGRYVSWTSGVGIWREDYLKIPDNTYVDPISPHSCILFSERNKNKYIIDDGQFFSEADLSHKKKGHYNVFRAFALEEPAIVLRLFIEKSISKKTLKHVIFEYRKFVIFLYYLFIIKKEECSYDLSDIKGSMFFFNHFSVVFCAYLYSVLSFCKKPMRRIIK